MTPTLELDIPDFGFIVGTRALLAAGVALLAGSRLSAERRRALGVALVTVGAATTIPAVRSVVRGVRRARQRQCPQRHRIRQQAHRRHAVSEKGR